MQGKADYKPRKGLEDCRHIIGTGDNPILILKKGEVPLLFNNVFYYFLQIWSVFHNGGGWPKAGSWTDQDVDTVTVVMAFENHFRSHFSQERVALQYLEAILKRMR